MSKILIIDDDEAIRKKYRKIFEKEGMGVLEASQALDVADILMREKSNIDLILLDLQIQDISGQEIYSLIRDYTQSIPIIVVSVLPVNEQRLKIPYARDYFQKGEGDKVLLAKARMILGLRV